MRAQEFDREQVITGLKIATLQHEDFALEHITEITDLLSKSKIDKSIEELWTDYLTYLVHKSREWIETQEHLGDGAWQPENMRLVLLITQPNLTEPMDNMVVVRAAQRVKSDRCRIKCRIKREADCGAVTVIMDDPSLVQNVWLPSQTHNWSSLLTRTISQVPRSSSSISAVVSHRLPLMKL